MTAADRLNAIVDDIRMASRSVEMARHVALEHGPDLVAALHAVLDLEAEYALAAEGGDPEHARAANVATYVRRAVEAALGEVAP